MRLNVIKGSRIDGWRVNIGLNDGFASTMRQAINQWLSRFPMPLLGCHMNVISLKSPAITLFVQQCVQANIR